MTRRKGVVRDVVGEPGAVVRGQEAGPYHPGPPVVAAYAVCRRVLRLRCQRLKRVVAAAEIGRPETKSYTEWGL